jgi:hypothetical protein
MWIRTCKAQFYQLIDLVLIDLTLVRNDYSVIFRKILKVGLINKDNLWYKWTLFLNQLVLFELSFLSEKSENRLHFEYYFHFWSGQQTSIKHSL